MKQVDIIVPVYNEEEALSLFHQKLCVVINDLPYLFRITYINDGSSDGTPDLLHEICNTDSRVTVLSLSRNFGHQAALTAGLDRSDGDFSITLDGDGQHPPELIPEMLALAEDGYEVVLTQRIEDLRLSPFKRWSSRLFYLLINRIGDTDIIQGGADFRLLARPVVKALCSMHEYHRFLRGMVAWSGFRRIILPFQASERLAGTSKYSFRKMFSLFLSAIFSFSLVPLFLSISLGVIFLGLAAFQSIYVLAFWIRGEANLLAPGWSSMMFVLLLLGGILMVALGFIGIYVGYIFQEVKGRPVYLISKVLGEKHPGKDSKG